MFFKCAPVAQLDRASDYGSEGRGFESFCARFADVAQLAEQQTCNQQVIGSSPIVGFLN